MEINYSDNLILENIIHIYPHPQINSGIAALRGIDLNIKLGEIISIIGASGSGKSTLLNIISKRINPSSGTYTIGSNNIIGLSSNESTEFQQKTISYMFQHSRKNLIGSLTVIENIKMNMYISNYPKHKMEARIEELLNIFDIRELGHRNLSMLSGGEAQRASLVMALVNNPKILIADEPTGELDSETTLTVLGYLKKINEHYGTTIIVATHDPLINQISDACYTITDGVISNVRFYKKGFSALLNDDITYIDNLGNIKIPKVFLDTLKIKNLVKLKVENNKLTIESVVLKEEKEELV